MTREVLKRVHDLLDEVSDGITEYANTLESTDVITDPLNVIYNIIEEELTRGNNMTPQEKWEKIYDVLDNMDVKYNTNYCGSETQAIIEFWTDTAGQDIPIEFDYDDTPEDFVKQFTERAENYDVDEEVELYVNMRGKNGVPNTVRELFDDCQEAKDTLMEIAEKLQKAIK